MDLQALLTIVNTVEPSAILAILGTGTGVAVILQLIKHYGKLQEAKKTVIVLLGTLSSLGTILEGLLQYHALHPMVAIEANLGWVISAAIVAHRFMVSPVYYQIVRILEAIRDDRAAAAAYRAEQAALPQPIVPVQPVAPPAPNTFSIE